MTKTTAPVTYFLLTRRAQGRTWYRTDSASCADVNEVYKWLDAMPAVPSLVFTIASSDLGPYKMAPANIRRDIEEYGK